MKTKMIAMVAMLCLITSLAMGEDASLVKLKLDQDRVDLAKIGSIRHRTDEYPLMKDPLWSFPKGEGWKPKEERVKIKDIYQVVGKKNRKQGERTRKTSFPYKNLRDVAVDREGNIYLAVAEHGQEVRERDNIPSNHGPGDVIQKEVVVPKVLCMTPEGEVKWSYILMNPEIAREVVKEQVPNSDEDDYNRTLNWGEIKLVCGSDGNLYVYCRGEFVLSKEGKLLKSLKVVGTKFVLPDGTRFVTPLFPQGVSRVDSSGKVVWSHSIMVETFVMGEPVLSKDGTIYMRTGGADHPYYLWAIDSKTGANKWQLEMPHGGCGTVINLGLDGTIYTSSAEKIGTQAGGDHGKAKLLALNPDKSLKWEVLDINSGNILVDPKGNLYFYEAKGRIMSLSPDGKVRWIYGTFDKNSRVLALSKDGRIWVGENGPAITCLDSSGKKVCGWTAMKKLPDGKVLNIVDGNTSTEMYGRIGYPLGENKFLTYYPGYRAFCLELGNTGLASGFWPTPYPIQPLAAFGK